MKSFNINNCVRIRLTPFGITILKIEHENAHSKVPFIGEFNPPDVDEDGYCEMQLWKVMQVFGEYMHNGALNQPFEMIIQIEDNMFEK